MRAFRAGASVDLDMAMLVTNGDLYPAAVDVAALRSEGEK